MLNKIKDYIKDDEFRLTVFHDRVYVINYIEIISLEEERISFLSPYGRIIVKGKNLSLNKLLDKEVLVGGSVISIEVDDNEE